MLILVQPGHRSESASCRKNQNSEPKGEPQNIVYIDEFLVLTCSRTQSRDSALAELETLKAERDGLRLTLSDGRRIENELERLDEEKIQMQEQANKDKERALEQKLEIERLTQENRRLNAEVERLNRVYRRSSILPY